MPVRLPAQTFSVPPSPAAAGSWRYGRVRGSRKTFVLAMLISAWLHAVVLFGFGRHHPKPAVAVHDDSSIAFTIALPLPDKPEEPEPAPSDEAGTPPEIGPPAPMLPDRPMVALPSDFVQPIDFASLIERPDLSGVKIFTIPENIGRGGGKIGEGLGNIFNLADLDRAPEPTFQPAPIYSTSLKSRMITGIVKVEFVVDTEGRVRNASVVETINCGFDAATLAAVAKWRFRPGTRASRKVNTRMRVPITFSLVDPLDLVEP